MDAAVCVVDHSLSIEMGSSDVIELEADANGLCIRKQLCEVALESPGKSKRDDSAANYEVDAMVSPEVQASSNGTFHRNARKRKMK
ncbi:hypothetical protein PIB30_053532 [Stylosanthes scabra]|uniref:Uncharacterized protein n=1 Tax=Stylosanthes scabra TaxID=79078 RepID=A0ABU6WGX2_9FABA|nr:hypothetical protein [Stylosanthes scabra]